MSALVVEALPARARAAAAALARVPGVEGIVLAGSRAIGTAHPGSDVDLGMYYRASCPPDPRALRSALGQVEREMMPFSDFNAWGPWMNGGGSFVIGGVEVDVRYRDVDRTKAILSELRSGIYQIVYQPGQPAGFASQTYLGDIAACLVLEDPRGTFADLRAMVDPYPPALRVAIVRSFGWEASLVLRVLQRPSTSRDRLQVTGLAQRFVSCIAQVVFATHERGWLGDKGAIRRAASFAPSPVDLAGRCERLVLAAASGAHDEVVAAAASLYEEAIRAATERAA